MAGMTGTIAMHALLLVLLYLVGIHKPLQQEEGGVPVVLGNADLAEGTSMPGGLTEVDIQPSPETPPFPQVEVDEPPLLTQAEEQTVAIPEKKKPEAKPQKPEAKPQKEEAAKPREKTEAEKRAEAEKAAAERASQLMAGAFGKGSQMGSSGTTSGKGIAGSPDGNSDTGKTTGAGGYGTFDLNGRSLGEGGLPRPAYNVQEEGRVVVTITVDPSGRVVGTSINKRTNTVNATLRRAAEEAAKQARFNSINGVDNQTGTITYYFKLR